MSQNLSDYSLWALERSLDEEFDVGGLDETIIVRRSDNEYISEYDSHDFPYGVTRVTYTRVMKPSAHLTIGFMTLGLSLPFTLLTDAVMRAGLGTHTYYFLTNDGAMLGDSRNKAAERADTIGLEKMREEKYEEAKHYFDIAYSLCESGYRNESLFKRRQGEAEAAEKRERQAREQAEREAREQAERERRARERERRAREQVEREREARKEEKRERQAREQAERERQARREAERERQARREAERERQARERAETLRLENETKRRAESFYREGQDFWNKAFRAETECNVARAKSDFRKSHELFSAAASLDPTHQLYKNWREVSALKLEGDRLFNEAVSLQEEGRRLRRSQKYSEALEKYKEAKKKYREALRKSNDRRFESCILIVDECMDEIREEMLTMGIEAQMERVDIHREENNTRGRAYDEEISSEDIFVNVL